MHPERREVLGSPVDLVTMADVLRFVRRRIDEAAPCRIATVNAEYVVRGWQDEEFRGMLQGCDLATPDGAGVVWALRRKGNILPYRVGGSDLIWSLCLQAAEFGHSVFLLGARTGVAEAAAARLVETYPGLKIAGTYAGTPALEHEASIVELVRRSKADVLFVAYGFPQQDVWIARNLTGTGAMCAVGVGGSLDYIAGIAARAPIWVRQNNLDWLWRLIRQPWRWRRQLALPRFVWLVWRYDGPDRMERIVR